MGSVQQARQATKSLGTVAPKVPHGYRSRQFRCRYFCANVASEAKAHLLVFTPDAKENGNEGVKAYLESGEAADIDKGYKTSIRDQWWVIPSIKLSDALFLRRNNTIARAIDWLKENGYINPERSKVKGEWQLL